MSDPDIIKRIEALEKEVDIVRAGLRIILSAMFGHETEKTVDQMSPEEAEAELDKTLAQIFRGEQDLDADEVLARALALEPPSMPRGLPKQDLN